MKLLTIRQKNLKFKKSLLEPENTSDSMFDELIDKMKTLKEAINDREHDDDEVSWSDFYDDELPPHYWGEDGNELIFQDFD